MAWRTERKSRIADAIVSWPLELCAIVVDYLPLALRWSADQDPTVVVSADRAQATIKNDDEHANDYRHFQSGYYRRLVGEHPLRETAATKWILMLARSSNGSTALSFGFRIGIVPINGSDNDKYLSPTISMDRRSMKLQDESGSYKDLPDDVEHKHVHFSMSADLSAGRLSARVFLERLAVGETVAEFSPSPWFSVAVPPDVLRESVPVVYFFGNGSTVKLINEDVLNLS